MDAAIIILPIAVWITANSLDTLTGSFFFFVSLSFGRKGGDTIRVQFWS